MDNYSVKITAILKERLEQKRKEVFLERMRFLRLADAIVKALKSHY